MGFVRRQAPTVPVVQEVEDPVALLGAADAAQRRRGIRLLSEEGGRDAVRLLAPRFLAETDPVAREMIATALIPHDDEATAGAMVPALRSEDATCRNCAAEALRQMPQGFLAHAPSLLADGDADVRLFAAVVLQDVQSDRVQPLLRERLKVEPHANVCAGILEGMGPELEAGDTALLQGLLVRFPDDPFLAFAVNTTFKRCRRSADDER